MWSWKRLLSISLCFACLMVMSPLALATDVEENQFVTYYADGSYSVTKITYDKQEDGISAQAGASEIRGTKQRDHYSNSDKLLWTLYVHGTFTCDGRTSKATVADYSYTIYDPDWSFVSGSASYSGSTARATGKFSWYGITSSASVSLTCSANGVLS